MKEEKQQKMTRREFLKLGGAVAGGALLASCSPSGLQPTQTDKIAQEPRRGGAMRVAFPGTAGQLDPALYTAQEDYTIGWGVYNGLTWVDRDLRAQPVLAKSWHAADDLMTWTFELRKGIKFHHGKAFTAEDVVYTFERILDESTGSPLRSVIHYLDQVQKVDDYTVAFHLSSPNADLPTNVGAVQARIVPHDRTPDEIKSDPVGTGPFLLEEYVPGDHTTLVRNEEYWEEGLPYLDEVRHLYMPEEATQIAALRGGRVHLMWQIGFENLPAVEADPNAEILQVPGGTYQDIVMRVIDEPYTDNRVRKALKLCVDRSAMQEIVLRGLGELGNDHPIPPINPYYAEELPVRAQDIEQAKTLLAEAGYEAGLDLTLHTSDVRPGLVDQAVAFKEMARPAGVRVEIKRVPAEVYWSEYWMKVPLCMSNWNPRPTADETLTTAYHSEAKWNETFFESEELDQIIEMARGETDESKRMDLYRRAQKLIRNRDGAIISYFKPIVQAKHRRVQNFHGHPISYINLKESWLAEE